jgi:hypothetical protein
MKTPHAYQDVAHRLWGDVRCLLKHPGLWKFDGLGANGKRWRCRVCGRL